MIYTTQQLINILDTEMRATCNGERILLNCANRIDNPVLAKALNLEKVGKVFAYQDFRRQIHEYQREYQVSGVIWRVCTFNNQTIQFPEIHNQLIAVSGDKEILMAAKSSILEFWQEMTQNMKFWLAVDCQFPISEKMIADLIQQAEWAEIDATRTDLYLGLCWGDPKEYIYQWAKPESGCHRIIAAVNQPSSIKV
ncbi:hypothetical protein [Chroococcus sp. FPU101]|uniref:hypothetical protein n=1 Tax=Chroococcus sp. FPU101 TaxID=1974212 RepID=UPI001A8CDCC0|nr:hypothetical protein [Chroococcus sp. FPU101]